MFLFACLFNYYFIFIDLSEFFFMEQYYLILYLLHMILYVLFAISVGWIKVIIFL